MSTDTNFRAGSKYVPCRDVTDIAKDIRADIKQARANGTIILPLDARVSIQTKRYSGGQRIIVHVAGLTLDQLWATGQPPTGPPWRCGHSEYRRAATTAIQEIIDAYNRDNSDPQADHYDVEFYSSVRLAER